jgi:hypothetical protein
MDSHFVQPVHPVPGNKGRLTGQKAPLKQKEICGPSAGGTTRPGTVCGTSVIKVGFRLIAAVH